MPILATLPNLNPNLFTPLPTSTSTSSPPPKPPIPPPKYPPPVKSPKHPSHPPKPQPHPALKTPHRRSNYYKPITGHVISSDGGRSVIAGESGVSYLLPGAPFEFQFSYSETPKAKPLAIREPGFLPFAPPTMARPWTGKAPMKNKARKERRIRLFESLEPNAGEGGGRRMEMGRGYRLGEFRGEVAPRWKVIGKPLTRAEITELVKPHISSNRQVNLGRDGLTHNMLELVHTHWKRRPVCKVRCLGVPTVDMDNVCRCLEEKTGGKIIHRVGGIVYLFRGRNYDPRTRPWYPVMLWKPATPVYPKLIQEAPEGLTKAEADELREKGENLLPICKLAKNGVYMTLVKDVRNAFEGSILVKIDCRGLDPSDYKRIGAKLKELVPCVLLSFDNEQILMWRGKDWKSMYPDVVSASGHADDIATHNSSVSRTTDDRKSDCKTVISSPKMMSLWKRAIETNKARLLEEIAIAPDDLLEIVEEFDGLSQATEHSYPALIFTNNDDATTSRAEYDNIQGEDQSGGEYSSDNNDYNDEYYSSDPYDEIDSSTPLGSLPVDFIANQPTEQ